MAVVGLMENPVWHRVRHLRPALRAHVKVHRSGFRGQVWYVIEDRASGRFFRFNPLAWRAISRFDGVMQVDDVLEAVVAETGDDSFGEGEMIQLLAQLHRSGALRSDSAPDLDEAVDRIEGQTRKKRLLQFLNPLAVRIPLANPEALIRATYPLVRPFLSVAGLIGLGALLVYAALQAGANYDELTGNVLERLISAESLLLLFIAYPLVKLLHEFGHAYALKRFGGTVPEVGIMLLVFMPVPYVDASAASGFPSKWARAAVGAAGIAVELGLAAIALLLWLEVEPGLFRTFLFNVMAIGGISTLLFNGNPLLKFDGYYVLSDLIEVPNLGPRANRQWRYIAHRYLFGLRDAESPAKTPGEARWLTAYAPAAYVYRLVIMAAILMLLADAVFGLGILLAVWVIGMAYLWPLLKMFKALLFSPALRPVRTRAIWVTASIIFALVTLVGLVRLPHVTIAEGVVSADGDARLVAKQSGVVTQIFVEDGDIVDVGAPIIALEDPLLNPRIAALDAEVGELSARLVAAQTRDRAEAKILINRLAHAKAERADLAERQKALIVRANAVGQISLRNRSNLVGQYVDRGTIVGHVVDSEALHVVVLLRQRVFDLARADGASVSLRRSSAFRQVVPAHVETETPAASADLPNAALGSMGGGGVTIDPTDPNAQKAMERFFVVEVEPEVPFPEAYLGERVWVRFDHGRAPLAAQAWRSIRLTFLERFET